MVEAPPAAGPFVDFDTFVNRFSSNFLENATMGVEVRLEALPDALAVWVNRRAAYSDPAFQNCGADWGRYERHLLQSCAYTLSTRPDADVTGWADRYGGDGIGFNGGSGRAVCVHGYNLKGVGRTPLVATGSDWLHSSGHITLGESIREAIFSEVMGSELPWSTVPVLAILLVDGSAGGDAANASINTERRAILVRPQFIRPAHFMRADLFRSPDRFRQQEDVARVRFAVDKLVGALDPTTFTLSIRAMYFRFVEQIAYCFVNRITQGEHTPSNITIDGRLVDFGAATALPSWAKIATGSGGSAIDDVVKMQRSLFFLLENVDRYRPGIVPAWQAEAPAIWAEIRQCFETKLLSEFLKLCGLPADVALSLLSSDARGDIVRSFSQSFRYYDAEMSYWSVARAPLQRAWQIGDVWSDDPPFFLRDLRGVLNKSVGTQDQSRYAAICRTKTYDRQDYYLLDMIKSIQSAINSSIDVEIRACTENFINEKIKFRADAP